MDIEHNVFRHASSTHPLNLTSLHSKQTSNFSVTNKASPRGGLTGDLTGRYASKTSVSVANKSKIKIVPNDRVGKEFLIIRTDRDAPQRDIENSQFPGSNRHLMSLLEKRHTRMSSLKANCGRNSSNRSFNITADIGGPQFRHSYQSKIKSKDFHKDRTLFPSGSTLMLSQTRHMPPKMKEIVKHVGIPEQNSCHWRRLKPINQVNIT